MFIINPGSGPVAGGTYEEAERRARVWHEEMIKEGFVDIELLLPGKALDDGRWRFEFKHVVTEKSALLETHGLSRDAVERLVFPPRVYWNGCSSGNPDLMRDFGTPEYKLEQRLVKKT